MFSKTCGYAIREIFIARKSGYGVKVGSKDICEGIAALKHFIAKILLELNRRGPVQSAKGPNGFFIEGESKTNTLADIVKAVDGDKLFTACGLGLTNCSEKKPCPLHGEFKVTRKQMRDM